MSTNFPTSLDSYTDKIDNVSTVLASSINNLQDAVAALQTKVGKDNSGVVTTYDYLVGDFFSKNVRQMYFYQNTPPVGWNVSGVATNCVVSIKGGAQDYNTTGGNVVGIWGIDDLQTDLHNHIWLKYEAGTYPYTFGYQSDGETLVGFSADATVQIFCLAKVGVVGNYINTDGDRNYVANFNCHTNEDSHGHSFDGDWRPKSAIGILAKYTGP